MAKHIWFSGATDVTGNTLAESLKLNGTRTKPQNLKNGDVVVCWGTKTKENVNFPNGVKVLNHPDKIRINRNKFESLKVMAANDHLKDAIAKFCAANEITQKLNGKAMSLPLVARKKYHQGGKGFWLCLTKQHVQKAIEDGAEYFQDYVGIDTEYRLHVMFGNVIYAVKKVENPNEQGWINQRKEKVKDYAKKNDVELDENTLDYVLKRLAKEAVLPDRIVRSNKRGWKFSGVRLANVPAAVKNAAVKAVEIAGLDFGAVDCAKGLDGNPYIIEINSGPGLQGTALQKYVDAFTKKIKDLEFVKKVEDLEKPGPVEKAANAVLGAVGAAKADEELDINDEALVHLMNAVKNPEEARRVLDLMAKNK